MQQQDNKNESQQHLCQIVTCGLPIRNFLGFQYNFCDEHHKQSLLKQDCPKMCANDRCYRYPTVNSMFCSSHLSEQNKNEIKTNITNVCNSVNGVDATNQRLSVTYITNPIESILPANVTNLLTPSVISICSQPELLHSLPIKRSICKIYDCDEPCYNSFMTRDMCKKHYALI